jgi:hypothetical protein
MGSPGTGFFKALAGLLVFIWEELEVGASKG